MSDPRKLYWDSSCFISFINSGTPAEAAKSAICADILKNAQNGHIEIWTSMWAIVEVIRPKNPPQTKPLPKWAAEIGAKAPASLPEVQKLWDYWVKQTTPTRMLSAHEIAQISKMFQWNYINKILVDEPIALAAVGLSRSHGLRPADAVHAASAIAAKCDAIQCWDRDYSKVGHLIAVEEPTHISPQGTLPLAMPALATPSPSLPPPTTGS
jgi:predicted nucleic acid-binding protein